MAAAAAAAAAVSYGAIVAASADRRLGHPGSAPRLYPPLCSPLTTHGLPRTPHRRFDELGCTMLDHTTPHRSHQKSSFLAKRSMSAAFTPKS